MAPSGSDWKVELFGPKILTKPGTTGMPTPSMLKGEKLVVLYFSASWCPPCRTFSPKLIEFYNNRKDDIEVVFVSSDRDDSSFGTYFGKMPWLAMVPSFVNKEARDRQGKLAEMFKIQGIPSVIVLDHEGKFVTSDGRNDVMKATSDEKQRELVRSWRSKEAVPIEDAVMTQNSGGGLIGKVVMMFLRNPAWIFGLIYLSKKLFKYIEEFGEDDDGKEL